MKGVQSYWETNNTSEAENMLDFPQKWVPFGMGKNLIDKIDFAILNSVHTPRKERIKKNFYDLLVTLWTL